jgi:hypothetical protein
MDEEKDSKTEQHLNSILFREAKLVIKNYEKYLLDKISSKDLADKMLSLSHIVKRIEDFQK